ncbi:MAG: hypothetical protein ACYCVB_11230, partial [Bacilli bacterium]
VVWCTVPTSTWVYKKPIGSGSSGLGCTLVRRARRKRRAGGIQGNGKASGCARRGFASGRVVR